MTPECAAAIDDGLRDLLWNDSAAASWRRRRWGALLTEEHRASISRSLDVTYGYPPGVGGWWIDRAMAVAPLKMGVATMLPLGKIPLVFIHRMRFAPSTIATVLFLDPDHPAMLEAFLGYADRLPHGVLITEYREKTRPLNQPPRRRLETAWLLGDDPLP